MSGSGNAGTRFMGAMLTNVLIAAIGAMLFFTLETARRTGTAERGALSAVLPAGAVYTGRREGAAALLVSADWNALSLERIVGIAEREGAVMTFALPARLLSERSALAERILSAGCELAVAAETEEELARSVHMIEELGGRARLFCRRGNGTRELERAAAALGLTVVSGSRDLVCIRGTAGELVRRAASTVRGGDIVICEPTAVFADALPDILREFAGMGLTTVTVSGTIYD